MIDEIEPSVGRLNAARRLKILAKTHERQAIERAAAHAFDERELNLIDDAWILVDKNLPKEIAGEYIATRNGRQASITLRPEAVDQDEPDTIVHEMVHHLRSVDETRPDRHRSIPGDIEADVNEDERRTEAESVARWNPHNDDPENLGYWSFHGDVYTGDSDEKDLDKANDLRNADRQLFTETENLPLKSSRWAGQTGDDALDAVDDHYHDSHIARVTADLSNAEARRRVNAIDTQYIVRQDEGDDVFIQAYSPNGDIDSEEYAKSLATRYGGAVYAWDEDAYVLKVSRSKGRGWHGEAKRRRRAAMKRKRFAFR